MRPAGIDCLMLAGVGGLRSDGIGGPRATGTGGLRFAGIGRYEARWDRRSDIPNFAANTRAGAYLSVILRGYERSWPIVTPEVDWRLEILKNRHTASGLICTNHAWYCYGSSHKSVPRVLVPLIQAENTLEVFRYIPMISAPQHSDSRTPPPLGGPHYTRSRCVLVPGFLEGPSASYLCA